MRTLDEPYKKKKESRGIIRTEPMLVKPTTFNEETKKLFVIDTTKNSVRKNSEEAVHKGSLKLIEFTQVQKSQPDFYEANEDDLIVGKDEINIKKEVITNEMIDKSEKLTLYVKIE